MIFLEQIVNQALREEGQLIVLPEVLDVSWEELEQLFVGVYEQCKGYITYYDWTTSTIGLDGTVQDDWAYVKHITYDTSTLQRIMPDLPSNYWEFNPYTKEASAIANTNYAFEVAKYPTLDYLDYSISLTCKAGKKRAFSLPCTFDLASFSFSDLTASELEGEHTCNSGDIVFNGESGSGSFNTKTMTGYITLTKDTTSTLTITSKYLAIKELSLTCELFYNWFKGALLTLLGSMKKQIDLPGAGLPFDINQDDLLQRGREIMTHVEELKGTKSHWSNF